jgi:hypothetical protein
MHQPSGKLFNFCCALRYAYDHGTVNHSEKEYVRGIHHVNGLESHWSLFKRAVKGTQFISRQSILGATAATCGIRTGQSSIFWFTLSRCLAYKTHEIPLGDWGSRRWREGRRVKP